VLILQPGSHFEWLTVLAEHKIGQVSSFPPGSMKLVEAGGKKVLIVNAEGTIHAIGNDCTHRGGPLNEGTLEGKVVTCPWHGGQFDVTTGKATAPPPKSDSPAFKVKIQGNDVMLILP